VRRVGVLVTLFNYPAIPMLGAVTVSANEWARELAADRAALDRGSTAERVAEVLRLRVTDGVLAPGTRLSEEALTGALGVSRNTLREAFRLLAHEGLLVHELNRGVFVRVLTVDDVVDLYRVRRIVELAAVQSAARAEPGALEPLRTAVDAAAAAAAADDWLLVGTHNMRFHQALAALTGSPRVNEIMRRLLAELRLVFHVFHTPRELHEPYLRVNREIYQLLAAGETLAAAAALAGYLDAAERQLVNAYARRTE
jgi:DNA-binding GntR family transcriptional regulator